MAKQKQREQEADGIRRDLENPEGILREQPQAKQTQEPEMEEQEDEGPERLSRKECAHRVIAEIDGDTTLSELAEKADKLFVAGRDGDENYSDPDSAAWHIRRELETLEGIGLVDMRWECVIHPNVHKLGLSAK